MSGYADSEKIQYALKTALYRTMQTSMSDSASVERSAPLRVFPTNIMKVNIIEAGEGDIGENGLYVTGHTTAGQTADLSDPESTVKNYKIICPVNNVITSITISALVGYGSSTKAQVDALPTSGQTYPLKQWFFRGHYSGSGEAAFNAANVTYDGLQLAWNSTTNNTTPSESDIVPHLKYYLQVQTNYTGVSHSSSADNITYEHGLLKGLIGLDSNFVSTIMVTQGEGGPSSSASLGTSGSQAGDFWFTQSTAGIISFYGVTNKVDASTDLATFNTKFPMVSYVRYTGETGFGAGTGGGSGSGITASLVQGDADFMGAKMHNMMIYRQGLATNNIAALMQEVLDTTWPAGGNLASALTFTNDKNFLKVLEQWNSETPNLYAFPHFPSQGNSWNNAHHTRVYSVYMKAKADVDFFLHHTNYQNFNASGIQYHCAVVCDLWNNTYTSVAFHNSRTHTGGSSNGSNWYHSANEAIPLKSGKLYKLYIISYFVNYNYYNGAGYQFAWQTSPQATPSDSLTTGNNYGSIQSTNVNGISVWYATMRENDKIEWYSYHPIIQQNGPDTAGGTAQLNLVSNHLSSNLTAGREIGQINFQGRWHSTSTSSIMYFARIKCQAVGGAGSSGGILSFQTGQTERMRIDDDGNVGIGTTSPTAQLHIFNQVTTQDTGNSSFPSYDTQVLLKLESGYDFDYDGASSGIHEGGVAIGFHTFNAYNATSLYQNPFEAARITAVCNNSDGAENKGDLLFLTNHNGAVQMPTDSLNTEYERMRITYTGNVGIGTASPTQAKLVVNASSIAGIYSMGDYTDYNYILNGPRPGNTAGGAVHFINHASRTGDGGQSCYTIRNDNGPIRLGRDVQITTIEGSKICLNSNVGIGVTNPSERLVVNTEYAQTKVVFGIGGNDYSTVMYIGGAGTQQRKLALISEPEGGYCRSNLHFCLNTAGDVSDATKENDSKMVIKNNGNVGIGTNSPYSKLEISAGADTSHIRISEGSHNGSSSTFLYPALTYYARQDNIRRNYDPFNQRYGASASISFTDRPGTYTYVNAVRSSDIVFHTATSYVSPNLGHYPIERMRISAEGYVQINQSTNINIGTAYKLQVNGMGVFCSNGSSDNSLCIGHNGSRAIIQSRSTTHNLDFYVNGDARLSIKPNGNVGIGTTSPYSHTKLHINGDSASTYMAITGGGSGNSYKRITMGCTQDANRIYSSREDGTHATIPLWFNVSSNSTPDMAIKENGNVGIGTTSPYVSLHASCGTFSSSGENSPQVYNTTAYANVAGAFTRTNSDGGNRYGLFIGNLANTGASYLQNLSTNNNAYYNILLQPNGGNVAIGTTSVGVQTKLRVYEAGTEQAWKGRGVFGNETCAFVCGVYHNKVHIGGHNAALNAWNDLIIGGGNVGIGTDPGNFKLKVTGGTSYFERACFGNDDINYSQVAIMASPYRTNLLMGRASQSSTYHGRWMYGGHHIDIYSSSTTQGEASSSSGTDQYLNYYSHYNTSNKFTSAGGAFAVSYSGGDYGSAQYGRKNLFIGATYNKSRTLTWGWWIGGQNENWTSSDGDLYFHVCRGSSTGHDAGYIQDSTSGALMNFTGQHRTFVKDIPHKKIEPYVGLIVSANQNKYIKMGDKKIGGVETGNKAITIAEALPVVALTTKEKDKACFGVICDVEDEERREFGGNFTSIYQKEKGDTRTFINSLGEGGIWVSDKNGNLESGDYITSSIIPGYGQKQNSEFLANYTVAKITMDCDFNPQQQKVRKIKRHDIKVTYYKSIIPKEDMEEWHKKPTPQHDYIEEDDEWVSIFNEEDYNNLKDEEWEGNWEMPTKSCYTAFEKDELENDMDENNEFMWEDTDEYEYAYNLRYLLEDGTQITKEEYETKKANNESVYIAAFVGCTYHCG